MSLLPPFREIRRHLPLVAGAFVLTHLPCAALLVFGASTAAGVAVYVATTILVFVVALLFGYAWLSRVARIVEIVRTYAENGSLPHPDDRPEPCVDQVRASLASLDGAVRRLEADAARDPLTGILNRRSCAARLEGDLARSRRDKIPFSAAIFDLDELKEINDAHGHAAGDAALRHLAHTLQNVVREGDWAARWGGDEFLLGLWNADAEAAALVAHRVLDSLADEAAGGRPLGASVGLSQAQEGDDATSLFSRADAALLEAKRAGRGRVGLS